MWIENNNLWFNQKELKNNNLNPELNKFLENNELSKEEAEVLVDAFEENKKGVLLISRNNLRKLRKILNLTSRRNYLTTRDKKAIAAYIPKSYHEEIKSEKFINILKHIDKRGRLKNVSKLRLDQLVSPYQKTKFSITLSKNSIYSSRFDWKTFNVIWWKDKRTWKFTYVFADGPLKRRRILIWDWDKLWEYIIKKSKKIEKISKKVRKKEYITSREYKNISERNKSFIDWLKLPLNYKKIALEFASKLKNNEVLTKRTPLALVDASRKEMLYTINWRKIIVPVLLWKNWITRWWYVPWDKKTLVSSNWWHSKTVKSASLQSESLSWWL